MADFPDYGDSTPEEVRDYVTGVVYEWTREPMEEPGPGLRRLLLDAGWRSDEIPKFMSDWEEPISREGVSNYTTLTRMAERYASHASVDKLWDYITEGLYASPSMMANPGRPPKQWMEDCIEGASDSADNPGAVCGSLWYHKMTPEQQKAALKREKNPTQVPTPVLFVVAAAILGGFYWLGRQKKAKAATSCKVDPAKLNAWAVDQELIGIYMYAVDTPISFDDLIQTWGTLLEGHNLSEVVVVTRNGKFWRYTADGSPVLAPELRKSYCGKAAA